MAPKTVTQTLTSDAATEQTDARAHFDQAIRDVPGEVKQAILSDSSAQLQGKKQSKYRSICVTLPSMTAFSKQVRVTSYDYVLSYERPESPVKELPVTQAFFRIKKAKDYEVVGPETSYEAEPEEVPMVFPAMEKFTVEREGEEIEVEIPDEVPTLEPVVSTFNYEAQYSHLGMDTVQSKSSKAEEAEIEQAAHLSSGQSPSAPLGTISNKTGQILTNKVMEKDMTQFQKGSLIDNSENGAEFNNNLFRLDVESSNMRGLKGNTQKPVIMSSREFPQKSGINLRNSRAGNVLGVVNMIDLQEEILPKKVALETAFAVLVHDIVADFPKVK